MTSAKKSKATKTTSLLPRWLSWALGIAFLVTAVSVSSLAYLTASAYWDSPFNPLDSNDGVAIAAQGELLDIESILGNNGTDAGLPPAVVTELVAQNEPFLVPTLESTGRTNILVMGIDRRPGEPYLSRTDSMIALSVDPTENRAAMLSIPRDLYVTIPDYGQNRVNTAFVYGAQYGSPAQGAELAMETVSYNLGLPIHHYLTIDFNTFVQAIDTLGGIDVDVPTTINDTMYPDMNYGYAPLYIPAGLNHFDGELALKYARTRHQDSDFHRAARQQQVVMAVRERVLAQGVNGLLQQGPLLLNQFEEGIRTDLSPGQMLALASAASQIPAENIDTAVLDSNYVTPYTTPGGASVLILQGHLVGPLIQSLFD